MMPLVYKNPILYYDPYFKLAGTSLPGREGSVLSFRSLVGVWEPLLVPFLSKHNFILHYSLGLLNAEREPAVVKHMSESYVS